MHERYLISSPAILAGVNIILVISFLSRGLYQFGAIFSYFLLTDIPLQVRIEFLSNCIINLKYQNILDFDFIFIHTNDTYVLIWSVSPYIHTCQTGQLCPNPTQLKNPQQHTVICPPLILRIRRRHNRR